MLTKKNVLVLGAGASASYGFPTGVELSEIVTQQLREGHGGYNHLLQVGLSAQDILRFRYEFFHSGKNSVDAFLEHRTDLLNIGKLATAAVLIPYENDGKLFGYKDSWLRSLYNQLNTSFEDFRGHQLAIITFNYDRSVEHFFFTSLENSYRKDMQECTDALASIPIIHLHGSLGPLPWQAEKDMREFSVSMTPDAIRIAAANIKIIHEDIKDGRDKEFERAKQLLQQADRVLFMGFGYNRTNMERLALEKLPANRALGTCVGMGVREKTVALQICNSRIRFVDGDCLHFVRELIHWQ